MSNQNVKLPGVKRSLSSVDMHIDRMRATVPELYKANNMDLHMCDGSTLHSQHGTLDDVRDDMAVALSCVEELSKTLRVIAEADDETYASVHVKMARATLGMG